MDDHGGTIDSLRRELVETHGVKPGLVRFARVPYRVCPLGAHVDHQLGSATAMALDVGLTLAYAPAPATRSGSAAATSPGPSGSRSAPTPDAGPTTGVTSPGGRSSS